MAKTLLGIQIGNFTLKMALCEAGKVKKMVITEVPDNLVRDGHVVSWEAMADFLKETMKAEKISCKNAAFIIPETLTYIRRVVMPAMTIDQLRVNLPYEFHDFITDDKDHYFYDYAVVDTTEDENGKPQNIDLLAVAVKKSVIEQYKMLCKRVGMKLVIAAPEICAMQNIIQHYKAFSNDEQENYAVIDLGHSNFEINIFTQGTYDVSRNIEPGLYALTQIIVEQCEVDHHIAEVYKRSNENGVLTSQEAEALYNRTAVEIMRVMNFYSFNHPSSNLEKIYYYGGGAHIQPLLDEIQAVIEPRLVSIEELFEAGTGTPEQLMAAPSTIGITME